MAKEPPYPLRLEADQENVVQDVCRSTGLSKAFVLRMAIDCGLAEMLGNSERIFRTHYKKPMPRDVAERYFAALKIIGYKQ